jgi:hypothetical protein
LKKGILPICDSNPILKWLCLYSFIVCISSWIHYFTTNSLKVDANSIEPFSLRFFIFFVIAFCWTKLCLALCEFFSSENIVISNKTLRKNLYLCVAIQGLTLPLFSNDVFSVMGYSQAHTNGINIYTAFDANLTDFAEYINPLYQKLNCKYGPLSILQTSVPFFQKEISIFQWLGLTKLIYVIHGVFFLEVSLRLISVISSQYKYLLVLYPLWLVQGIGQFHNDIFGMSWIILGLLMMYKSRPLFSSVFFSLAVLSKITFGFFALIPLLYWAQSFKVNRTYILQFLVFFVISLTLLGYLIYWPFQISVFDIISPIKALNTERPSSTFSDLGAYFLLLFNSDFEENFSLTIPIFRYVGISILLVLFFMYWRVRDRKDSYLSFLLLSFTTIFLFVFHRFLPWYLMGVPFLFLFKHPQKYWFQWLIVITWISIFQDYAIMLDTGNLFGQILMAMSTVLTVLSFFFLMPKRLSILK